MSYHKRTDLGAEAEHEFTLPVGIVELTWKLVGKVIRLPRRLIQETFTITSAKKTKTDRYQHIASRRTLAIKSQRIISDPGAQNQSIDL